MATKSAGRWGSGSGRFGKSTGKTSGSTSTPAKYKSASKCFASKVTSFKTLLNQTSGTAKCGRPTPSTLNSFANWINKGAVVQCCSKTQITRWANAANVNFNSKSPSLAACKNVLAKKFGKTTIKAVAQTKTGSYMVATSPTQNGKPFCFPKR